MYPIVVVETWMARELVTVGSDARVGDAVGLLDLHRIRRLLVIDDGRLVGIASKGDLRRGPLDGLVHTIMSRAVTTTTMATPLEDAATQMLERKIGALPVLDATGRAVGILTESDVLRALIANIAIKGPGVRITFRGNDPDRVVRFLVDAARTHGLSIQSILVIGVDSGRRVLAKLTGVNADGMIDAAWRSGHGVMSALRF
ncbi:MAG: CBS domain-containing protein [Proteobacteria bacterium]|nr:CBS domain-containing protein [Pseudomonadota bacterium]